MSTLTTTAPQEVAPFSLLGGPLHVIGRRLGLVRGTNTVRLGLVLGVGLWLAIVAVSVVSRSTDRLFSWAVVGGHARLLLAIPLYFMCESWVDPRMTSFVNMIASIGIVPPGGKPALNDEVTRASRWAKAWQPELVCLLVAIGLEVVGTRLTTYGASEVRDPSRTSATLSALLYFSVGVTLFRFLLFRWAWKLALWSWFLWRLSRLDLHLISGHPDRDGGLGPLEGVHERFALIVAAHSILQCASLVESISTGTLVAGVTIYPWVAMVLLVDVALFLCPLLVFTDKLWASRTKGVGTYSTIAAHYVTEFEAKWTGGPAPQGVSLLGPADRLMMADLDRVYGYAKGMRWITVGPRLLTMMAVTGVGPFLPLLLFQYPIAELAQKVLSKMIGI